MNKIFYVLFAAQALLVSSSTAIGLVAAQNESGDIPTTQAVGNLTNATSNPEDIKQMEVIGGTVNATLNESAAAGMTDNMSSPGGNVSGTGGMDEKYNTTGSWK
jgi:hypothetical protein